jgi:CRP-like cAMP-binding protein
MLPLGQRIARRLLDLGELDNKITSSQAVIADFLGVSRVSVGKTLKEFQLLGFIEIGYGSITILNADALRDYGSL